MHSQSRTRQRWRSVTSGKDRTVLSYYSSSAMSSTLSHLHFFYTRRSNTSRESRAIRAADRAAALFSKWDRVTGFISLTLSLVIS
jgi:hypothetical protein